jgi:hypothetical protein
MVFPFCRHGTADAHQRVVKLAALIVKVSLMRGVWADGLLRLGEARAEGTMSR